MKPRRRSFTSYTKLLPGNLTDCERLRFRKPQEADHRGGLPLSHRRFEALQTRIMAMRHHVSVLLAVVCLLGTFLSATQAAIGTVGAPTDVGNLANSVEIDELANFAVDRYKSRQNSIAEISFSKVLSVKEQVVQGIMYYLTIEVMEGGEPKQYDAKVWVKPWEGYKELESFESSVSSHYDSAVHLSVKSGDCHEEQIAA